MNFVIFSTFFIDFDSPWFDYFPLSIFDLFFVDQIDVDFNTSNIDFPQHFSPFYPQLSLIVEREDLPAMKNEKKLILLANGFFDNPSWGFVSSASETSKNTDDFFIF